MEKYKITVDNISAVVISLSCSDILGMTDTESYLRALLSREVPSGISLAVYPSPVCDLGVRGLYTEGGFSLEIPPAEALLIFSAFWRLVRGNPCTELEVDLFGTRTLIELVDTPHGIASVKLEKCKLLLSFSAELDLGVPISLADASVLGCVVRGIITDSPSMVPEHTLRGARILHSRPDARVVCAISHGSPEQMRIYSPYPTRITAALGAAAYLFSAGKYGFDKEIDFGTGLSVAKDGVSGTLIRAKCSADRKG